LNRAEKYLGFDDRWLVTIGIPTVTLTVTIMMFGIKGLEFGPENCLGISLIFTATYWITFRQVLMNYHKKFTGYKFTFERLSYIGIRLVVVYFLVKFILEIFVHRMFPIQTALYHEKSISAQLITIIVIMLVFFIYEGIYYLNKSRLIEIEKNKLEKVTAEQKLSTLKDQVNPHFLFNALNSLNALIRQKSDNALTFVDKLSYLLRSTLQQSDEDFITLKDELDYLDAYIFLQKERFGEKFEVRINSPQDWQNQMIPSFSLQLLVENAIKHNVISKRQPLVVEVYQEDHFLVVKNPIQIRKDNIESTGTGLGNLSTRFSLLKKRKIEIINDGEYFIVKLPILE